MKRRYGFTVEEVTKVYYTVDAENNLEAMEKFYNFYNENLDKIDDDLAASENIEREWAEIICIPEGAEQVGE